MPCFGALGFWCFVDIVYEDIVVNVVAIGMIDNQNKACVSGSRS